LVRVIANRVYHLKRVPETLVDRFVEGEDLQEKSPRTRIDLEDTTRPTMVSLDVEDSKGVASFEKGF
jgi:hypothetical protein